MELKEIMEKVKLFLESSTIHGLVYISTAKRLQRLFWILVVVSGFTCAGVLINEAFQGWAESSVSTTIETLPIAKVTLPKITVCPPKNTATDLNYELMVAQNSTLSNDTRSELVDHAISLILEQQYQELSTNVSKVKEENRFYNWYHGLSKIILPAQVLFYHGYSNYYNFNTSATSGSIVTKSFGHPFNVSKFDHKIRQEIQINIPSSLRGDESGNFTLQIDFEKIQIPAVHDNWWYKKSPLHPAHNSYHLRIKNPGSYEKAQKGEDYFFILIRSVSSEELKGNIKKKHKEM